MGKLDELGEDMVHGNVHVCMHAFMPTFAYHQMSWKESSLHLCVRTYVGKQKAIFVCTSIGFPVG